MAKVAESVFRLVNAGLRAMSKPISFAIRKGADMHPRLRQYISEMAQENEMAEQRYIDYFAYRVVVSSTMAGAALVYERRSNKKDMEKLVEANNRRLEKTYKEVYEEAHAKCRVLQAELEELRAKQKKENDPDV